MMTDRGESTERWLRDRFDSLEQEYDATGEPGLVTEMERVVRQIELVYQTPEAVMGPPFRDEDLSFTTDAYNELMMSGELVLTDSGRNGNVRMSITAPVKLLAYKQPVCLPYQIWDGLLAGLGALWRLLGWVIDRAAIVIGYTILIPWIVLLLLIQAGVERYRPHYVEQPKTEPSRNPEPEPEPKIPTMEQCAYCHVANRPCACKRN